MSDEQRPLRSLNGAERLSVKLRRCPTCHGKLEYVPQEEIRSWQGNPAALGKVYNGPSAIGPSRMMTGSIIQLRHGKIPHCPECQLAFIHGWIYPVE